MLLRPKLVSYILIIASIPLSISMTAALWQSSNQTRALTLDIVQGHLESGAAILSGYFDSRKAEIAAYANTPIMKGMDFQEINPYLKVELARHKGTYEKFILGTPEGYFYNTAGGNRAHNGLRTFNDNDPKAKRKSISKRDYWQDTVGKNSQHQSRIFVSEPMISYTTGAKQIVVAASIRSENNTVTGMIGGALPWDPFQERIKEIFSNMRKKHHWDSRFFLVSRNGVYWYHWNPANIVQLKKNSKGQVMVNEIGEKIASVVKITDDKNVKISQAGKEMLSGKKGYKSYIDPSTNETLYLVYAPVPSTGYSVGLVVPKSQMMSPVYRLEYIFGIILFSAAFIVIIGAWILSKKIVNPISSLNKLMQSEGSGISKANLIPTGSDEVTELTHSFNNLINSIVNREHSITQLNDQLEQRVISRTKELEEKNNKIKEIEIRQRAILESVTDTLITTNEEGVIESVNHATEIMFRFSEKDMIGKNVSTLIPKQFKSENDPNPMKNFIPGEANIIEIDRELMAKRKDNSLFPIKISVSEMVIKNDRKFSVIIRDLSQQKESEETLRRDSDALKRLNEIATDLNDTFEKKLLKLLKLGIDTFKLDLAIISKIIDNDYTIEYIIGPDGAPSAGTRYNFEETYCSHTYAANGPIAFEHAGISSISAHPCYQHFKLESYIGAPIVVDGKRYGTLNFSSAEIHPHSFSHNELTLIQLLAQWIGSELSRSRAEQELSRFKTTLDLTMDCVFMFETGTLNFFYVNQGAINQIGYSDKELFQMKPYEIKPNFTEAEFKRLIQPMLSGEIPAVNFETLHQHKNGKQIPVEIFLQYINPKGEQSRFVAIVRDITDRQQSTQKLNDTIEEMTLRTREITLLSSLGDLLHSCQDLSEAYSVVSRFMPMLLPHLSGALYLTKISGENFEKIVVWGDEPPEETYFPADDCVAVRRGLSYLTKVNESALFCKHHPSKIPAFSLCLPLSAQGETIGLLHLQSIDNNKELLTDFDGDIGSLKQEFAETVAKQVAMALASLRLKEQLRNQSIRDPLTGLFNRRYMEETFVREIKRASRNNLALSFIMIDIDHFKKVNDTYGHEAGDEVLKAFGNILRDNTRGEDIACRFGGEEFVICLPCANITTATAKAENIRKIMGTISFHLDSKFIEPVTVSMGVSIYPEHGDNIIDLVKAADKALYTAKNSGRNQVVVASLV